MFAPVLRRLPAMSNVPYLDVVATMDSGRKDLALFVAIRDWKAERPAAIRLRSFHSAAQATVHTLKADSILDGNYEEHPEAVRPVTSTLKVAGDTLHYTFPEHSLTVITFEPK